MDDPAAGDGPAPVGPESADEIGRVEARGIHYVPETDRHSHPRNLAWAMFGPQFGFRNMVFGSLGIVFGLSWWSTFTAVTVGVALISFVLAIYGHATLVATFRFIEVPLEGQSSAGSPEP